MRKSRTIPERNRSATGWWVYCEVLQWVSKRQRALSPSSRCRVWENMRLIRARDRREAFQKATKLARVGFPLDTVGGQWRLAGISMLLPLFEDIGDGAEILCTDHGNLSVKRIRQMVRSQRELPVFQDDEPV